jgi:hypothetical protein
VKLLYAMAFALFPLAAPAQSPDTSLLTVQIGNLARARARVMGS